MKDHWIFIRLFGVIMAIAGAVIIVHTVPVFVWYIVLLLLIIGLLYLIFHS